MTIAADFVHCGCGLCMNFSTGTRLMPALGTSAQSPGCEVCADYAQATREPVLIEEFMPKGEISYAGFDERVGC